MSKLLGVEVKNGVFTSKDGREIAYNNIMIHVSSDVLSIDKNDKGEVIRWGIGAKAETFKVKNEPENLKAVFGVVPDEALFRGMIGHDINIYFNQYGAVSSIMFPNEGKK